VKKFFFLTLFFLAVCGIFHKQILGLGVKYALKSQCDCEFAYRSVKWVDGALVFSDLVLFDSSFHVLMERASIQFDWSSLPKKLKGHLTIDSPHVSIIKERSLPKMSESWLDFALTVNQGTVEWDGLVRFSLIHAPSMSQLSLDWKQSGVVVTHRDQKFEAELKNFKAALLKTWFPYAEILDGYLTGRIVLDEEFEPHSANLKIDQFKVGLDDAAIKNMHGTLSYNANLGAKWELQGEGTAQGKQFPFEWEGRGFFKRRWIESEIHCDQAYCKISGEEIWALECNQLSSAQVAFLQAGAAVVWPEISNWNLMGGVVSGKATFSLLSWTAQFEGHNLSLKKGEFSLVCAKAVGDLNQDGGSLVLSDSDYEFRVAGGWNDWNAETRLGSLYFAMNGGWDGEKFPVVINQGTFADFHFTGSGWIDSNFDLSFLLDGAWTVAQKQIPFHCPNLTKQGELWAFDFRFVRKTWDLLRFVGMFDGKEISQCEKSHFLGMPLRFSPTELGSLDVELELPWKAMLSAGPMLKEWGVDLAQLPPIEETKVRFKYDKGRTEVMALGEAPLFKLVAEHIDQDWKIDLQSDLNLHAILTSDGNAKGKGSWKSGVDVEFEGKIHPSLRCDLSLSKVRFDLSQIEDPKMEGIVEGKGHLIYDGQLDADFDLTVSALNIGSHPLENEGEIHLSYSSDKGALFRGLNLHGPYDCVVDLLEYNARTAHWIFHNAQVHLPGSFLTHRFLQFLDKERDLNFTADLDFASDFSTFICTLSEGVIPFNGASHPIENLNLTWSRGECLASLYYLNDLHRVHFHVDDQISGRLILGDEELPLSIDWEYKDALVIHSIDGSFGGVEASFHAESSDTLIGSARVNFTALSERLPLDIAQGFDEIKLGKGYELKGRLKVENNIPRFQGILCGKQIELFGFQFRTILGQVDLAPKRMRIYDVKISDSAGMMKVDEILLESKNKLPWTIKIPHLSMHDLRPSLLQRPGGAVGPISPLVVRELKITDFKGLLDDASTYVAEGQLHFINSYKRGETVFDLPANVLSRIVGLDLELLIPVCGDLKFELKEGYFNLLELTNAYSEGKRSEFFLEMDPQPCMDLDGNLEIFIKMKQFVLLKITESLLISIDGVLDDPHFHLKKKRFFGLM